METPTNPAGDKEFPNELLHTLNELQKMQVSWMRNVAPQVGVPSPRQALWHLGAAVGKFSNLLLSIHMTPFGFSGLHPIAEMVRGLISYCHALNINLAEHCVEHGYHIAVMDLMFIRPECAINWENMEDETLNAVWRAMVDLHYAERLRKANGVEPKVHLILRAINRLSLAHTGESCVIVATNGANTALENGTLYGSLDPWYGDKSMLNDAHGIPAKEYKLEFCPNCRMVHKGECAPLCHKCGEHHTVEEVEKRRARM